MIHLWENGAPGFEERKDEPEQAHDYWVRNVHNPSITVFSPPSGMANGCAIVVAPGGGFRELVYNEEGKGAAEFLQTLGITVFVLKYRLPYAKDSPYHTGHVRQDAYRAIRMVRSRASEFGIDPDRIGFLGFSAGAEPALMVAFAAGAGNQRAVDLIEHANGRPNFEMLIYPSVDNLVPRRVPADTPAMFLLCANDDEYGCDKNTLMLLKKLREAKVSVEAHFIAQGKHSFNMGGRSPFVTVRHWPDRLSDWLEDRGWLKAGRAR